MRPLRNIPRPRPKSLLLRSSCRYLTLVSDEVTCVRSIVRSRFLGPDSAGWGLRTGSFPRFSRTRGQLCTQARRDGPFYHLAASAPPWLRLSANAGSPRRADKLGIGPHSCWLTNRCSPRTMWNGFANSAAPKELDRPRKFVPVLAAKPARSQKGEKSVTLRKNSSRRAVLKRAESVRRPDADRLTQI